MVKIMGGNINNIKNGDIEMCKSSFKNTDIFMYRKWLITCWIIFQYLFKFFIDMCLQTRGKYSEYTNAQN